MKAFTPKIVAAVLAVCLSHAVAAEPVREWNAALSQIATASGITPVFDPFNESRLYAMTHIAVHDALNAIDRRSVPYVFDDEAPMGASPDAAVAAAVHGVVTAELPNLPDLFAPAIPGALDLADTLFADALAAIPDGPGKQSGIDIGHAAAQAIVALRTDDGSDTLYLDPEWVGGTEPGDYRFTVDGPPAALAPEWRQVTPFALNHAAQFRSPPPYSVSCQKPSPDKHSGQCRKYADDWEEVLLLGGNDASGHLRTPEQTQIAMFWLESSPLSWNRLARQLAKDSDLDSWQSARLFGLLNIAMADGYIGSMETKYFYNYWRPITAIRQADGDGNPETLAQANWLPAAPTPPFPDYDSAHATEGAAAAEVFHRFFGSDFRSFDRCSLSLPDPAEQCGGVAEVRRSFNRFSAAAEENGESRVLVGYHFRKAVDAGLKHGKKIGKLVSNNFMIPVD